jgi:hypothetical protein
LCGFVISLKLPIYGIADIKPLDFISYLRTSFKNNVAETYNNLGFFTKGLEFHLKTFAYLLKMLAKKSETNKYLIKIKIYNE